MPGYQNFHDGSPRMNELTARVLLVSLGTSPAVVPEAFLLPEGRFCAVHVLTTEKPDVQLIREFFDEHAPGVSLTLSRVAGFDDLASEEDHFRFEEVLYRWVIMSAPDPASRFFCLSGGFKTMSAAMQKAAAVLGAAEVFHVLANPYLQDPNGKPRFPETIAEIRAAASEGQLKWIRLGRESGWPQFRAVTPADYPLEVVTQKDSVRWLKAQDGRFREHLQTVVERSHRIADAWKGLADLPFVELATGSHADLQWLRQPLEPDSSFDQHWVTRLPKLELHCHLGGFATEGDLLARVREAASAPQELPPLGALDLPADWPHPAKPIGLEPYRKLGDNNGSVLLRDPGCLRQQCELLYDHLIAQGVIYAEIRCSPANYADPEKDRTPWKVLTEIKESFDRARDRAKESGTANGSLRNPCQVNLLLIGTRQASGDFRSGISRHLALAVTAAEHWTKPDECRVVGVDLAGFEDRETRAHYFREEFTGVHRCGLALTVHAGENDEAEGIWRAVFDLNARRLGHGLSLKDSKELRRSVADRGIGVEMCPYANLQIRGFILEPREAGASNQKSYPLLDYLREGIRVTVNTDNIGISQATLTDNLLLAARLCPGLTRLDLLQMQRNAIDTAFVSAGERARLTEQFAKLLPKPACTSAQ